MIYQILDEPCKVCLQYTDGLGRPDRQRGAQTTAPSRCGFFSPMRPDFGLCPLCLTRRCGDSVTQNAGSSLPVGQPRAARFFFPLAGKAETPQTPSQRGVSMTDKTQTNAFNPCYIHHKPIGPVHQKHLEASVTHPQRHRGFYCAPDFCFMGVVGATSNDVRVPLFHVFDHHAHQLCSKTQ